MQHSTQDQNNRLKKIATICSISLSVSLVILKTFAALYTGSLSILSSLIDSLSDTISSSISYVAVKFSAKPASYQFRYGYGKAEALSALIQSLFIAGSGVFILYDGISRIFTPKPIEDTKIGIIIMLVSLISTLFLIVFQKKVAKITSSQAIAADSAHYTVDVATNISIIITLIAVNFFDIHWLDSATAVIISVFLLANAYSLSKQAVATLLDAELDIEIRKNIKRIVNTNPFAKGIHDLRTRDLGGKYLFEFHLELDGNMPLSAAHDLTEIIEDSIKEVYPFSEVVIHQDPAGIDEERLDKQIIKNKNAAKKLKKPVM